MNEKRKPIDSIGQRSTAAIAKNANSCGTSICPCAISQMPEMRLRPNAICGMRSSQNQISAMARALLSSVWRSVSAWRLKRSRACLPRPNAFSTRMPCTLSSTLVARSPA